MFRAGIAPDEAEDAGGLDARQGRQRSMAQFLPEQIKGFYGSLVLLLLWREDGLFCEEKMKDLEKKFLQQVIIY